MNGVGMQNKTIKKFINKKVDDWLTTVEDDDIKKMIEKDLIITGGCIASMTMGDPVNDYDVYFKTRETTLAVAKYYVEKFKKLNPLCPAVEVTETQKFNIKDELEDRVGIYIKSLGIVQEAGTNQERFNEGAESEQEQEQFEDDGKGKYRPVFLSENAITLSNKLQIVIRFYGDPEQIHQNFDYIHAMCYFDYKDQNLVMPIDSIRSMQSKTLYYSGSLYPICSLFRMKKFINRGWKISAGEIVKMCFQISKIDLTDIDVLREQLTGVDAAYFFHLIQALQSVSKEKISDLGYVCEVIDRIFNDK